MTNVRTNQNIMPSILNELMNWNNWEPLMSEPRTTTPKMNITESATEFEISLCVPGLTKEDLSVSIDSESNLVIEMAQKEMRTEAAKEKRYLRREFGSLQFKRMLSLPENVKKEQISATVENGILNILLPKYSEQEKQALSQRIEIK